MDGTIIQQGRFTSTGVAKTLVIRSDVDWMYVYNFTEATTVTGSRGVSYYWQRGMAANNGFVDIRNAGGTAIDRRSSADLAVPGFTLVDSSVQLPGPLVTITNISNVGLVLTANTTGLSVGTIVRLMNATGAAQLGGQDFTVTAVNPGVSFTVRVPANMVAAAAPGAGAAYRIIAFDPIFYPRRRLISAVTAAASAVVTTTVDHGYLVGQEIRFNGFADSGMIQIEGLSGSITAVTASTFTVDIDSTTFTAFAFPLTGAIPVNVPQAVPLGEDTAVALAAGVDILTDATRNTAFLGMILGTGITSPAGSNNDVIYWRAGKSFSVDNQ